MCRSSSLEGDGDCRFLSLMFSASVQSRSSLSTAPSALRPGNRGLIILPPLPIPTATPIREMTCGLHLFGPVASPTLGCTQWMDSALLRLSQYWHHDAGPQKYSHLPPANWRTVQGCL